MFFFSVLIIYLFKLFQRLFSVTLFFFEESVTLLLTKTPIYIIILFFYFSMIGE